MRKFTKLFSVLVMLCAFFHAATAQTNQPGNPLFLGQGESVFQQFRQRVTAARQSAAPKLSLQVSSGKSLNAKVNVSELKSAGNEYLIGEIENVPASSFYIELKNNALEGSIILRDSKEAYKYYTDTKGNAYIREISLDSLLCINYDEPASQSKANGGGANASVQAMPDLQSYPGANGVVLLDFDGHYVSGTRWNGGNPIDAQHSGMSYAQMQETWEIVSEDFRPFNVNITTNEAVFNSYPKNRRMRCIITPTNTAAPGAGGVAYVGSFSWNDDTPCWTFITSPKGAGEASSHEVGHTLGLYHDGRTNPSEGYFRGHGDWAPIMGVGYYENVTQWSKGEYAYANNTEDDLAKIASTTYGLGYRTDDHAGATSSATALSISSTGSVAAGQNNGVVERSSDVDMFSFSTGGGTVQLNFNPVSRHADLDILVRLYNASGSLLATYNPAGLSSSFSRSLSAGQYYVAVTGTGAGNPATDGYSGYGSLGYYSISGTIPVGTSNQAPAVSLTSPSNGAAYTSPASVTIAANASDADGTVSKVAFYNGSSLLAEDTSAPYSYTWSGVGAGTYTITARATDNDGAVTTSAAVGITVNQPQTSCSTPSSLGAGSITSSSATLSWSAQSGASGYLVWWRTIGGSWTGNNVTVSTNSVTITGLQSGTAYEFTVAANCSGSYTAYATPYYGFSTADNTVATVYQHCNYSSTGYAVSLAPGNYTLSELQARGINDNSISSLKVQSGYEVILYRDNNYSGGGWIFRGDYSCLTNLDFNDKTSSVVVRASTAGAAPADGLATTVVGNEPQRLTTSVTVAPNPVVSSFSLKFSDLTLESADVQLVDAFGKKIKTFRKVEAGQELDLAGLPAGVYLLRIKTGNQVTVERIIKQ